jgi:hypothetical protein
VLPDHRSILLIMLTWIFAEDGRGMQKHRLIYCGFTLLEL